MTKWAFLNDSFVEEEKALLHFKDLSFQRGYGVFDFFRLIGNQPLFMDEHLNRFYFSAQGMYLPLYLERDKIKSAIIELIQRNDLPNTGIRLSLSGGNTEDGFTIGRPNFLISQNHFTPPTNNQVHGGIKLMSYHHQRQLPHIKSIDYLMAIWLQPKRIKAGADDILYHQDGIISESPRNNFFLVTADSTIVTPISNALAGITRKNVIQLAKKHFAVEERDVRMEELQKAKEAFITSTTRQILPVAQVDDVILTQRSISHYLLHLFQSAYGR